MLHVMWNTSQAIISSRRLSKYFSCPEHLSSGGQLNTYGPSPCLFESEVDAGANPKAIVFQNASCVWSSSYEVGHSVILDSISLDIPEGIFVAIIGEVNILSLFFEVFVITSGFKKGTWFHWLHQHLIIHKLAWCLLYFSMENLWTTLTLGHDCMNGNKFRVRMITY